MLLYRSFLCFSIIACSFFSPMFGAEVINRNGSTTAFNQPITAKELDRYSGTLYVITKGDGEFTGALAARDDTSFTPLATGNGAALAGLPGRDLALIHTECKEATHAGVISSLASNTFAAIFDLATLTPAFSATLMDADGDTISGKTKLAASTNCLFVRVLAAQSGGETAEPIDSGIATLLPDATIVQGSATEDAVQLDPASTQVKASTTGNLRALVVRDMHWNECLQTFYAGMLALTETDTISAENTAYGLVKGTIDSDCNLTLARITNRLPATNSTQTIFAARPTVDDTNDGVNMHHVRCMNTSTGLSYLIVNGDIFNSPMYLVTNNNAGGGNALINDGLTNGDLSGNKVWALPLGSNPTNDACATNPRAGCVVQNQCSSAAQHLCCETPCQKCVISCNAGLTTDLFDNFTITDCSAVVGGTAAPWSTGIQTTYTGPSISYYLRNSDQMIVSNVEDDTVGDADGTPTGANTLALRLVQNETQIFTTQPASDMVVVGDAVYASAGRQSLQVPLIVQMAMGTVERVIMVEVCADPERDDEGDVGLWVTQAQFDNAGCIAGWTAWERAYPTTGTADGDKIAFFDVDAKTGKIWKVANPGEPDTDSCADIANTVCRTQWSRTSSTAGSLQFELDAIFNDPCKSASCCCPQDCGSCVVCESETKSTCCSTKCGNCCACSSPACGTTGIFSVLDLPGNTSFSNREDGFNGTTSYALFGGFEKVVFSRTRQTDNDQTPPNEYNLAENFHSTSLPKGAGAVCSLGYTHRHDTFGVNSQRNFFYAATTKGLYGYAQSSGAAFNTNADEFDALDEAPFDQSSDTWHLIPDTEGLAITITENDRGNNIYYVALDVTSCECTVVDKLYSINLNGLTSGSENITDLTSTLIAQSGSGGIHKNAVFTGFKVVSNHCLEDNNDTSFYGVLSTNDGIYVSSKKITDMTSSDSWKVVPRTKCIAFNTLQSASKLYAPGRFAPRNKLFGLYFKDGGTTSPGNNCQNIFQHSSLIQLGDNNTIDVDETAIKVGAHPDFNEQSPAHRRFAINRAKEITHLDFSTYFWSDGGRRMFARFNPADCNITQLHSLPWDGCEWNMTESFFDSTLSSICRVHWVENISSTGQLMAGTDRGVIILE